MAKEKLTPRASIDREALVAINNAIALVKGEDVSRAKMTRMAAYTRALFAPLREHIDEGLFSSSEGALILLSCAALLQQARLAEEDRKIPAQEVLDIFFEEK